MSYAAPTIEFRPLDEADLPALAEWRARPHVAEWFGAPDSVADLRGEFIGAHETPPHVRGFLFLTDGRPAGFIQSYVAYEAGDNWWPDERDPGARGIDQFLADEDALGRGLGTAMVRAFLERLFRDLAVTKVQTDPDPANARAIRCYEKAGFERMRVVQTPDGPALLMVCTRTHFETLTRKRDSDAR